MTASRVTPTSTSSRAWVCDRTSAASMRRTEGPRGLTRPWWPGRSVTLGGVRLPGAARGHHAGMSLSADQLSADEHVVLEMREHWKHLLWSALVCGAALVGLVLVLLLSPDEGFLSWLDSLGWLAFAGMLLLFGVVPGLAWWNRTYALTNKRLVTRKGAVRRSGRDIPLTRINDVAFEQGILDRVVGAGTLKVSAASDDGTVVLTDIPRIHRVTLLLNDLVRDAQDPPRVGD